MIAAASTDELLVRTAPLTLTALRGTGLDPDTAFTCELRERSELYGLVTSYLAKLPSTRSFNFDIGHDGCDDDDCGETNRSSAKILGLGVFPFEWAGKSLYAVHQTLGQVVGGDCGASLLKNLVLCSAGDIGEIKAFCDHLIAQADKPVAAKFTIYRFQVQHQYWHRTDSVLARHVDSVVLPSEAKQTLLSDLDDFTSRETKQWYVEHGIPYKRSYLFHGSPGAGKTSLIQGIAGRYSRNVCYLSPSHPDMSDDAMKSAVQRVPAKSIIVLEDVDALFEGRKKKGGEKQNSLTFSGLLNALDGVGGSSGQIFILTTNHRERLDPALIRNGRVDLHIEFKDASREQMADLFKQFYKAAPPRLADEFAAGLSEALDAKKATASMAQLQHYFIMQRKASAEDTVKAVHKILEEQEARKIDKEAVKETEDKDKEDKDKEEKKEEKGAADVASAPPAAKKEVHIHIHNE